MTKTRPRRIAGRAKKRTDVRVQSTGLAGAFGSGGQYLAEAFDGRGSKFGYAYGGTENEARRRCAEKVRARYESDSEILY
jgi:hypothetical protein